MPPVAHSFWTCSSGNEDFIIAATIRLCVHMNIDCLDDTSLKSTVIQHFARQGRMNGFPTCCIPPSDQDSHALQVPTVDQQPLLVMSGPPDQHSAGMRQTHNAYASQPTRPMHPPQPPVLSGLPTPGSLAWTQRMRSPHQPTGGPSTCSLTAPASRVMMTSWRCLRPAQAQQAPSRLHTREGPREGSQLQQPDPACSMGLTHPLCISPLCISPARQGSPLQSDRPLLLSGVGMLRHKTRCKTSTACSASHPLGRSPRLMMPGACPWASLGPLQTLL